MILNGYDTFVGGKVSVSDNIPGTLKMLSTTNNLQDFGKTGVKILTRENNNSIKPFIFPMTLSDYKGNMTTIMDNRHYVNTKGRVVNDGELEMMSTAALLQQLAANNSKVILNSSKPLVLKAFARSIAGVLGRRGNLNPSQRLTLAVILGHYYNCLLTSENSEYQFVSQNAIREGLRINPAISAPIIEEVGYINTFKQLFETIRDYPAFPTLAKLDIGGFIGLINQTWFVTSGFREIIGASIEMPHLYTAICYVSVTNNLYRKTAIGLEVDPKENSRAEVLVQTINSIWPN